MKSPAKSQSPAKSPTKEKASVEFQLQRPNQSSGTRGMAVQVITNHVKLSVPNKDIYMYTAVTDDLMPRERKEKLDALYKYLVSIGHRVYASGNTILSWEQHLDKLYKFPFGRTWNKETQQEEDYLIEIQVKFRVTRNLSDLSKLLSTNLVDADVQELIQICDIMIKFDPSFKRLVLGIGQFSTKHFFKIQGSHLTMLKGMQSHTKLSDSHGILLNIDAKYHFLFQELNLHDSFKASKLSNQKQLQSEYKGVKVIVQSNTTKRKSAVIVAISDKNANTYIIPDANISVFEYFKSKGIILRHPNDLLVCVNKKRMTFYPPELLKIAPNNPYEKPCPDINMIRNETCLRPRDRLNHIKQLLNNDLFQIDPNSDIQSTHDLLQIPARFINPCDVLFKQGSKQVRGKVDTRNELFDKPCAIQSTCIINFASKCAYNQIKQHLITNLQRTSHSHGIQFPNNPPFVEYLVNPNSAYFDFEQGVEDAIQQAYDLALKTYSVPPTIFICITPSSTCHVYNHVKRLLETTPVFPELVMSQFVLADKFQEQRGRVTVNAQYCSNLLLKMNEKLSYATGGNTCAWRLSGKDLLILINKPSMILGIDVSHGDEQRSHDKQTSVATFVGSVDPRFSDYRHVYKHCLGEDTSAVITECMVQMFNLFKEQSKCYPDKLVVYRDGLSEGQFQSIGSKEIMGIRAAATELGFELELLFISCIKRHNTRFFSGDGKNIGRSGNLKSGLVIDKQVTGKYFEFYMQSHEGLQGTAIPTRYVVLHDDLKLSGDDVQQFTLNLCCTLQRSAASCSIPAVIKMADLFAERIMRYEKTEVCSGAGIVLHSDLVKRAFYC